MKSSNNLDIYLHLGPHKTGTTSFQYLLEKNESFLISKNICLLTVRSTKAKEYKKWRREYGGIIQRYIASEYKNYNKTLEKLQLVIGKLAILVDVNCDKLIISDENLLGPIPGHSFPNNKGCEKYFYSAHDVIFESMYLHFGKNLKTLMLVQRDIYGFIISSYRDYILKLENMNGVYDFYKDLDKDFCLQYNNFYNLEKIKYNILQVKDFNDFVKDFNVSLNHLLGFSIKLPNQTYKVSNQSITWEAIDMALNSKIVFETEEERRIYKKTLLNNRSMNIPKNIQNQIQKIKKELEAY
ncbi:MAG: hypothetical protein DRG78_02085 [Epsilonproteobacteria bacterium]|nr:MAG: hypothetical protein DRG78_02085 [Campylobacterota bacterium]